MKGGGCGGCEHPKDEIAHPADPAGNRRTESHQPETVEQDVLDIAVQQRIGKRRPEQLRALLRQRRKITQRDETEIEEQHVDAAVGQNERLHGIDGRQQGNRRKDHAGKIEDRRARRLCGWLNSLMRLNQIVHCIPRSTQGHWLTGRQVKKKAVRY
jgi:hypothetical protein